MSGSVIGIFCVAAFLVIIGIVLLTGHGSVLIAGYNTMKKEEKEKYDEKKLCRGTGILVLIVAAICVTMDITEAFCTETVIDTVAKICAVLIILLCVFWIVAGNFLCKK